MRTATAPTFIRSERLALVARERPRTYDPVKAADIMRARRTNQSELPPDGAFATLIFEKIDQIACVTLNRPEQLNAYNMAMRDDLYQVLGAIHDDPDIKVMVLVGAGSSFSTGGDLTEFGSSPSAIVARWVRFRRDVWGRLRKLPIPTLAAIHGYTVGGGFEMALLCDLIIAAEDTRICLPETGAAMIPGVCGTQTTSRRLGLGRALDLCMTGRWIDAREAVLVGFVAEVVPSARLKSRALEIAHRLIRLPRKLSACIKLAVWDGLDLPLTDAIALERRLFLRHRLISTQNDKLTPAQTSRKRATP